eukprot:Seg4545.3 transcript_id=Seg4545.3/GoldUCD/mRNA.D3Y31 product="hypothetical protein" protein_id=Seg4545.3/GoldUCD/D3Y31
MANFNPKVKEDAFIWTDNEVELLLECVKVFASDCLFEGKDWEGIKSKYDKIRGLFRERYPKVNNNECEIDEEFPKSLPLDTITKERIAAKVKNLRKNYKKAVDLGKRSGGGRIVMTYYDLCNDIWAGAPATRSIEGGIDSSIPAFSNEESQFDGPCESSDATTLDTEENSGEESSSSADTALIPKTPKNVVQQSGRREKIEKFLSDQRERKMAPKISIESQQLNCLKEDLALKRKVSEQGEAIEKEFLAEAKKNDNNNGANGKCHVKLFPNDADNAANTSPATSFCISKPPYRCCQVISNMLIVYFTKIVKGKTSQYGSWDVS